MARPAVSWEAGFGKNLLGSSEVNGSIGFLEAASLGPQLFAGWWLSAAPNVLPGGPSQHGHLLPQSQEGQVRVLQSCIK